MNILDRNRNLISAKIAKNALENARFDFRYLADQCTQQR